MTAMDLTIIIPAFNEAANLPSVIERIRTLMTELSLSYEILVVNDCSTDETGDEAGRHADRVVSHAYNMGNGAAVKTGIRSAHGRLILLMDADGQHPPEYIPEMLDATEDYDLVVGARTAKSHAGIHRLAANSVYNWLASYVTKFRILDLTSGFRVLRRETAMRYLYMLPNTFSYPTTLTMAILRSGLSLKYISIEAPPRSKGTKSKIKLFRDGARFFLIISRIATLFSPFRIFLPLSAVLFVTGCSYYLYTFLTMHRFTNMSMLLLLTSLTTFMLGLISEQISLLRMDRTEHHEDHPDRAE
jgi:glycosyltransferase involved in cell wall biosynthesis